MAKVSGEWTWSAERDEDGARTYKVTFRVISTRAEGPASVMNADGLPQFGDTWAFSSPFSDVDIWAFCKYTTKVTPILKGEPNTQWDVECTFDTKPPKSDRCQTTQVEDPLLIPPKLSGPFVKYTEEAQYDRFGNPILNSALELIRGPKAEFDKNRPSIKIEMNVPSLQLPLLLSMKDTVNAFPIWGFPPRCVKLSNVGWERKFYGVCFVYFTWNLDFDVLFETFDRDLLDEATKVLNGRWTNTAQTGPTGLWQLLPVGFLPTPSAPTLTPVAGGGMPTGTYTYVVTAISPITTAAGNETNAGPSTSIAVNVATTTAVIISWNTVPGASGYSVYSRIGSGVYERIATNIIATSYADNGMGVGGPPPPATNTAGGPPDPKNPQHFIQYKDRKGEPGKIILNGAGVPASVLSGLAGFFISIQDSNTNHALNDDAWWLPLASPIQAIVWQPNEVYEVGALVTDPNIPSTRPFICTSVNAGQSPQANPSVWTFLPNGTINAGSYSTTTTYAIGQYVIDNTGDKAGTIHVSYYPESDFSLLGLPANLDTIPTA